MSTSMARTINSKSIQTHIFCLISSSPTSSMMNQRSSFSTFSHTSLRPSLKITHTLRPIRHTLTPSAKIRHKLGSSVNTTIFLPRRPTASVRGISHSSICLTAQDSGVSVCTSESDRSPPQTGPLLLHGDDVCLTPKGDRALVIVRTNGQLESGESLFDYYVNTLAPLVGSEEEAKKRIYLVSYEQPLGFGANVDEDTKYKLQVQSSVSVVLDDCFYEARNKAMQQKEEENRADFKVQLEFTHPFRAKDISSYYKLSEPKAEWKSDHWLVHTKVPDGTNFIQKRTIDNYVEMLAEVIGSEEEAKKKLYIVWNKVPYGFGAEIDQVTANKLQARYDVLNVLPDYAYDLKDLGILCVSRHYHSRFYYPLSEDRSYNKHSTCSGDNSDEDCQSDHSECSDDDSNEDSQCDHSECSDDDSNEDSQSDHSECSDDDSEASNGVFEGNKVSKDSNGDSIVVSDCSDEDSYENSQSHDDDSDTSDSDVSDSDDDFENDSTNSSDSSAENSSDKSH
ncbi:hypothetical protein IFM89_026678 [Coptis chinensis]|uniref:MORF/ORRM1/DAG-like MORF domain-containing protein n=1 Tax=Coptis chinensis TaxID=261450 RepID=A0A835IHJ5_9MAGN|nr:hypothetical protein IFM89_026678 [Coptis chinensis]